MRDKEHRKRVACLGLAMMSIGSQHRLLCYVLIVVCSSLSDLFRQRPSISLLPNRNPSENAHRESEEQRIGCYAAECYAAETLLLQPP